MTQGAVHAACDEASTKRVDVAQNAASAGIAAGSPPTASIASARTVSRQISTTLGRAAPPGRPSRRRPEPS